MHYLSKHFLVDREGEVHVHFWYVILFDPQQTLMEFSIQCLHISQRPRSTTKPTCQLRYREILVFHGGTVDPLQGQAGWIDIFNTFTFVFVVVGIFHCH